jgi:hypothetical protein
MTERSNFWRRPTNDLLEFFFLKAMKDADPLAEEIRQHVSRFMEAVHVGDRDGIARHRDAVDVRLTQYIRQCRNDTRESP